MTMAQQWCSKDRALHHHVVADRRDSSETLAAELRPSQRCGRRSKRTLRNEGKVSRRKQHAHDVLLDE